MSSEEERAFARGARMVALVIAGAGLLAIFAPLIVQAFRLEARYEFLFYLMSMGAFIWALAVLWRLWNNRPRR